ncbi:Coatomer subunit [Apiospora phragmitis]|uniref:Coatomer subunit n=1 Tax=Apiospora phragmitis TaxID=2905665 RepID=A0ABR1VRJ1_9PEZI
MDTSKQPHQDAHVYTTVGSIYNPSAAPLQPPTRRGRPVKWPPYNELANTKSSLSGLSLAHQTRSPSNTAPASNLLHYSPLQQNSERAISPMTSASDTFARMSVTGSHGSRELEDDEDDAGEGAEKLKVMSVKTLTNLASYPNPMQRQAQKVLSRARPTANTLATLRGARSDPVSVAGLLQSDGTSEYSYKPITRPTFDSILSKGPGAPQPLTAGPPGPRRFKSSANEQTSDCRSSTLEPLGQRQLYPVPRNDVAVSVKAAIKETERRKITDTLTAQEAAKYYIHNLPSDFDYLTKAIAPDWQNDSLLNRFGQSKRRSKIRSPEEIEAHRAKIDEIWYAGSDMMSKSVTEARLEKNRKDLERTIGIQSGPFKKGRTYYPKLKIEEANRIPASEHSVPLISMAYQTLLNHPEFNKNSKLPRFPDFPTYK